MEHYFYTDSSAARQSAQRQGVGRTKHVFGKFLWIDHFGQDANSLKSGGYADEISFCKTYGGLSS